MTCVTWHCNTSICHPRIKMVDHKTQSQKNEAEKLKHSTFPTTILIFSGKRKSGKDFITDRLYERIGKENSVLIKLSGPIKTFWAEKLNLDNAKLFGDGDYKENHRLGMVKWSENIRNQDYGYFCRAAVDMYEAKNKTIWIVSDARRKSDLKWFSEHYGAKCKTIRISSSDEVRRERGWTFVQSIDDAETECNLDDIDNWDLTIINDGKDIEDILCQILNLIK